MADVRPYLSMRPADLDDLDLREGYTSLALAAM
jgi:hypothetical protein